MSELIEKQIGNKQDDCPNFTKKGAINYPQRIRELEAELKLNAELCEVFRKDNARLIEALAIADRLEYAYHNAFGIDLAKCTKHGDAIRLAIEALEKQIPKKPRVTVASHNVESYWCANCDGYIANTYDDRIGTRGNNCKWCGQAIDWGETE